jgi:hypothetical protein
VGVLRHGQDDAIALLRRFPIVMISVVMLLAFGVLVSLAVGGVMPAYWGRLLREMMHPVRRGSGEKKPECGGDAQVQAALEFRE